MRYLLLVLLAGCYPYGNTDPSTFRSEYAAMCVTVECSCSLYDYDFTVEDDRTSGLWQGLTSDGAGECGQIYLPPVPSNRCTWRTSKGNPYARAVIHELLHGEGYRHGDAMQAAEKDAWKRYALAHCSE